MAEKILVVEDELSLQETLAYNLKRQGYEVETTGNGLEALDIARRDRPDLILLDIMLPGMDGFEATRQIKADPRTAGIPVVALTARALTSDREAALAAGCDDYDTKPVDLDRLICKVRNLLGDPAMG